MCGGKKGGGRGVFEKGGGREGKRNFGGARENGECVKPGKKKEEKVKYFWDCKTGGGKAGIMHFCLFPPFFFFFPFETS